MAYIPWVIWNFSRYPSRRVVYFSGMNFSKDSENPESLQESEASSEDTQETSESPLERLIHQSEPNSEVFDDAVDKASYGSQDLLDDASSTISAVRKNLPSNR